MIVPTILERWNQGSAVTYDIYSRLLKDRILFVGGFEGQIETAPQRVDLGGDHGRLGRISQGQSVAEDEDVGAGVVEVAGDAIRSGLWCDAMGHRCVRSGGLFAARRGRFG